MRKPSGYDEAKASGEFTPVDLGGHHAIVKQVSERQSSTGKDMIVVLFDFDDHDKQVGYFTKQFNGDDRPDKKWPYLGSKYIMVSDYNDPSKTSRAFKTFCTCIEKSNNCQIQWGGNNWAAQFRGKKIGVVYGEEENEYEGKISMRRAVKWFCRYDQAEEARIPDPKYLNGIGPANAPQKTTKPDTPFMNIPDEISEDEIPF